MVIFSIAVPSARVHRFCVSGISVGHRAPRHTFVDDAGGRVERGGRPRGHVERAYTRARGRTYTIAKRSQRLESDIVLRRRSTFGAAAARPPSIQRTCRARNTDRASKSTSLVATPIATTCGRKTAAPRRVRDAIGRGEVRGFMWFHARTPRRSLAGVGTLPCESPASVAHCGTTPRCARSARRECRTVAPNSGGITPV